MAGGTSAPDNVEAFGVNKSGLHVDAINNFILVHFTTVSSASRAIGLPFHGDRLVAVSFNQVVSEQEVEKGNDNNDKCKIQDTE
jgi:hypothetical protein